MRPLFRAWLTKGPENQQFVAWKSFAKCKVIELVLVRLPTHVLLACAGCRCLHSRCPSSDWHSAAPHASG